MATVHMISKYRIEVWAVVKDKRVVSTFMSELAANRRANELNSKGK